MTFPAGEQKATYKYIFLELRTDEVIEEIDLYGVYCFRQLNQPGQFNGSFKLDQTGKNNADLIAATEPGKTWVVVERDGVPVYWGILWSRTYQSQAKTVELYGWGFEAYPTRRVIDHDFLLNDTPNTKAFCALWNDMQGVTGANLNINVPTLNLGPNKDVTALASDYHYYSDIMQSISDASDGFDWTVNVTKTNDNKYAKNLVIGYPTLGAQNNLDQVTFEYPGCITNYYATDSMSEAGTNIFLLGAGEGADMPVSVTTQSVMINQDNWPRWDYVSSHKDVDNQSQVVLLAQQEAINRKPPAPTYKATVQGYVDPIFGSYSLGDSCQLVITDPRYPSIDGSAPGLVVPSRIIGWELRPPTSEQTEEINILLPGDTVNG